MIYVSFHFISHCLDSGFILFERAFATSYLRLMLILFENKLVMLILYVMVSAVGIAAFLRKLNIVSNTAIASNVNTGHMC